MASRFSNLQWQKISDLYAQAAPDYGLPERRDDSVVIGSFNIRKLGTVENRTPQAWRFLKNIIGQFDLIAIQEVLDDLSGLEHLLSLVGDDYGMVVSDITGAKPGTPGNVERLAFLFNWKRISRTALASDVTFDRTEIANNLYDHRGEFSLAWREHIKKLDAWKEKAAERKAQSKSAPAKPALKLPRFVSFIRQPHCVSFRVKGPGNAAPYEFLVVLDPARSAGRMSNQIPVPSHSLRYLDKYGSYPAPFVIACRQIFCANIMLPVPGKPARATREDRELPGITSRGEE